MAHYGHFSQYCLISPVYEAYLAVLPNNDPFQPLINAIMANVDPA